MTHNNSFKTMFTIAMIVGVALAAPRPDKPDISNEIIPSGGFTVKNGETVGASWGGFHASASLADDGSAVASAGGNGLGASSGYGVGGVGAGAGLYGTGVASESGSSAGFPGKPAAGGYGNGGKPAGGSSHQGGLGNGFFDKIFAIPINVLQSVNTYLNQKQQMQSGHPGTSAQGHHDNNGGAAFAASASSAGEASYGGSVKAPAAHAGADYGHESAGHGKPGSPMMIPITALRSVQNLLNG
ncbi:glycine-rich protein 5-like isoform X2 [Sipha flava]|uniref:Glycine-rich protein 5-like isoform X2 n=1 Tax=Sipha flava TaxID=143950 RepID=A0A8B8GJD1_9HEMI|nr:glycine-rich protein 5-like isoform X2 [Sipha flava]